MVAVASGLALRRPHEGSLHSTLAHQTPEELTILGTEIAILDGMPEHRAIDAATDHGANFTYHIRFWRVQPFATHPVRIRLGH